MSNQESISHQSLETEKPALDQHPAGVFEVCALPGAFRPNKRPGPELLSHIPETQELLNFCSPLPLNDLKSLKNYLASEVHQGLLKLKDSHKFEGLIVQDGCCPGTLIDSFISLPDAANYVCGSICTNHNGLLLFTGDNQQKVSFHHSSTGQMYNHFLKGFAHINDLPGDLIVGVNGTLSAKDSNEIMVYIGDRASVKLAGFQFRRTCQEDSVASWRANQVISAVAALHLLSHWISMVAGTNEESHVPVKPRDLQLEASKVQLSDEIIRIKNANDLLWRDIYKVLLDSKHSGIVLGESFTGGKIASLLHSLPGSSHLIDTSLVWYAPEFKKVFEVAEFGLTVSNIASPATTMLAAEGLLKNTRLGSGTAVATSGFTNVRGEADHFSVSVMDKHTDSKTNVIRARSAQVKVLATSMEPVGYTRKEFTRQMGASVALILIARTLESRYQNKTLCRDNAYKRVNRLIRKSCAVEQLVM